MNRKRTEPDLRTLRAAAEARVAQSELWHTPPSPADSALHQRHVHQIELEMQNEELQRARLALEASRDRYLDLYESSPVGYLTLDREGMIAEVNLTATGLLGEERQHLLNQRFAGFVASEDGDRWRRHLAALQQHGERQRVELALRTRDGARVDAQLDCLRFMAEEAVPMVRIALTDISERKQAQAELGIAATAFEAEEAMIVLDSRRVIRRVNRAFTQLTGHAADEAVGGDLQTLGIAPQGGDFHAAMWETVQRTGRWQGETWNRRSGGAVYPAWLTLTAVYGPDRAAMAYFAILSDMTERQAAQNQIDQLAYYDTLTRLPNRRLLQDRLVQALSACELSQQQGALLFIDLDNFKGLNDTRGHDAGDLLLQQVASRLTGCLRETETETVARAGGDEFVVLLENLGEDREEATAKAELVGRRIITALDEPYRLGVDEYFGTPSIGLTMFGDCDDSVVELLKQADLAMYQAKAAGRNTLRLFHPEMRSSASRRAVLEADLRQALKDGGFLLHYQAQVDRERRLVGAEALLRWQHPRRGLLLPAEFVPVAEQTGLILPLGEWVLEAACAQLAQWGASPDTDRLSIAVNISAPQLRHPQFVAHVLSAVHRSGIDARRLRLELTESMLLTDLEDTIVKMTALKARDVRFSLDDFGTGYSSLSYLKRLLLYQVKIDQSFVKSMLSDPDVASITRTIVALGRSLGLSVMAEGVETESQWGVLADMGCNLYQGYLFGRPGPVAALRSPSKAAS